MESFLDGFRFVPDGTTTLSDALCSFIKEQITFGHLKGGERMPTINEIAKATGLTFGRARGIVERLAREGYVHSRPHAGTVVLSRNGNLLKGRVLVVYPDVDVCRYYPTQLLDTINRRLKAAGYSVSVVTFPFDEGGNIALFESELLRATDLVIALRTPPKVQKCLAESGIRHIFAYGDKPIVDDGSPWISFSDEEALAQFVGHCEKVGVKHVVQVCFEGNELFDAGPALAAKGIESSSLMIARPDAGRGRFDGIVQYACEKFEAMPRESIPDLLLFWNAFAAQGAMMAFLDRGIRIPEDVKVVVFGQTGFGPVYIKPVTRFESDPMDDGEKISDFALAVLAKGRIPAPPTIAPQYIFGSTFPF